METYLVDTHSLVWFIVEDDRLSQYAECLLRRAEEAEVQVLIPTLVLAELCHIAQKKRVRVTIEEVLECIGQGDGFAVVPFDFAIFQWMLQLPNEWEIHDRIIAGTACHYKARLITKDETLRSSEKVEAVW